ncbi:DUF6615 family protein [Hymenobacter nivis]|uniref:Uncharacterized protein n=1 Tax=Hymenobacter nivis TaxID=1850093 RepID=A0A502GRS7_9BACT|nr:DUF6615 family protein [Hymenobacter nivis]TPG64631.1 hypothetical protein EAH73_15825 [Hymenobacter nivis]
MLTDPILQAILLGYSPPMSLCDYSSYLSQRVYRHLSDVFRFGLSFSELGLTDHFILDLARFSHRSRSATVKVYKTSWPVETAFGNDIDLFVGDGTGQYDWYALQAKVMSHEGEFNDLKIKAKGEFHQWLKLLTHERLFGSQAFYLLYVGKSKTNFPTTGPTKKDCNGVAPIGEYGLSLVKALNIHKTVTRTTPMKFTEVFPDLVEPLRSIFCCPRPLHLTARKYTEDEIATPAYRQVYARAKSDDIYQGYNASDHVLPDGFAPLRVLIDLNSDVDENKDAR